MVKFLDEAGLIRYTEKLKNLLAGKQDMLEGAEGQVVGFDSSGKAVPQGTESLRGPAGKDGVNGKDGTNGKDGISVTHQWNGTTLTVTSVSGTSSADLRGPAGADGKDGATGAKGETEATGAAGPKGDPGLFYGTCDTAGDVAEKKVSCAEFVVMRVGAVIAVKFANTNTADNPKLNINGMGAKEIYYADGKICGAYALLAAGITLLFVYDGEHWCAINPSCIEGTDTTASGQAAHAESSRTLASGICSHAEGAGILEQFSEIAIKRTRW